MSGNVDGALDILVSTGERRILPGGGAFGGGGPGGDICDEAVLIGDLRVDPVETACLHTLGG